MKPGETYFRAYRNPEVFEILREHPPTFVLAYVIAYRARYSDGLNVAGLDHGEALIGDHDIYGLSAREYRTAKRNLEKWQIATFKPTSLGTVAKLIGERVFGVLTLSKDKPNDEPETSARQARDKPATTINKDKKGEEGNFSLETAPTRPKKPRARDPLFDAIVKVCGMQPESVTASAGSEIGNALKEISEACPEVSPDIIRRVAANYRAKWRDVGLTPSALAKHWPKFINEDPAVEIARLEAEIAKHLGNRNSARYHVDLLTSEIAADYKTKTDRLRQLKSNR